MPRRRLRGAAAETSACALRKVRIGPKTPRRSFRPEARGARPGSGPRRASVNPAAGGGAGSRQDDVAQYNAAATAVAAQVAGTRNVSGKFWRNREGEIRLAHPRPSPRARSPGTDYAGPLSRSH